MFVDFQFKNFTDACALQNFILYLLV